MNKNAILEVLMKCNRCGLCQEVCPTYRVSGNEFAVARGRNRLIRMAIEGQLEFDKEPEIEQFINECLLCKACETNCPSGVPTPELISQVREYYTSTKGLPIAKKIMYRGVFSHNKRIDLVRRLAKVYQKTGIKTLVRMTGVNNIFNKADDMLPDLPKNSVRGQLPMLLKNIHQPKYKVAYFLGCSVNNFFSSIGVATIKVLQKNSCQIIVPDVNCCGAPHNSAGDQREFKRLAIKNLKELAKLDPDAIIVDCSTCGSILKEYVGLFENEPEYQKLAKQIAEKVKDISSFLIEIGFKKEMGEIKARVTYHDPCHGVRFLNVQEAPREILKSIPGIELIEMNEADMCCGGAGSYSIFYPKLSRQILSRKINNFKKTGASILATSCPACTMQLSFGMKLHELTSPVKHPVELLAEAYDNKAK
jgi:glycolate oxidase iron-sulfur subunit